MEHFEFNFVPTRSDFVDAGRVAMLHALAERRIPQRLALLAVPFVLFTGVLLVASIGMRSLGGIATIIGLYVCGAAVAGLGFLIGPHLIWFFVDPGGRFSIDTQVTVDHDSIRTKTSHAEQRSRWSDVKTMLESRTHFVFTTETTIGGFRLMGDVPFIPRRAFQSTEQQERFRQYAQRKIRQWSGTV